MYPYTSRDHVSISDTAGWTQQRHVPASTSDAADVSWSPDGNYIALVECGVWRVIGVRGKGYTPLVEYQSLRSAWGDTTGMFIHCTCPCPPHPTLDLGLM